MIMATPEMSTRLCWRFDPFFTEYPALEGEDIEMFAFLDLGDSGVPDVVAGFSPNQPPLPPNMSSNGPNPLAPKPYEVAQAIPNSSDPTTGIPSFGTLLTNNTGNVYLFNSAAHPNLEFSITQFLAALSGGDRSRADAVERDRDRRVRRL